MENETNLSSEKINSLLSSLGVSSQSNSENVEKALKDSLSPEQRKKINNVLADPERLKKILSSPQAKMLINMIKDKKE